jgi:prepilin-type N-terminal cleavage/methylation domain-containing protein
VRFFFDQRNGQEVRNMWRTSKGFTLIELMLVVTIIGILAAIAIPNFISMQDRAKEGRVKGNMHTLQTAVEDFAIVNGRYPLAADGPAVESLLSGTVVPDNPFGGGPTPITWGGVAVGQGGLGYTVAGLNMYSISGFGSAAILSLTLSNF